MEGILNVTNGTWNDSLMTNTSVNSSSTVQSQTPSTSSDAAKASALIKCSVMICMFVLNIIGNSLTVEAIRKTERLRTNTNMMVAALAVDDLLVGLVAAFYTIWNLLLLYRGNPCPFRVLLILAMPIQQLIIFASNVQIVALALDRYVAVVYPLHYEMKMTPVRTKCLIAFCWIIATVCTSSYGFWLIGRDLSACSAPYTPVMAFAPAFSIYMTVLLSLVLTYGRIFQIAVQQRSKIMSEEMAMSTVIKDEAGKSGAKKKKSEFKAAKMIGVMVSVYLISWLPVMVGRGLIAIGYNSVVWFVFQDVGLNVGLANNSLNWIIYAVTNKEFRAAYKKIITCDHYN